MLEINWSDVINILNQIRPHLIVNCSPSQVQNKLTHIRGNRDSSQW